jgi:arylsulfatase A-like enzyme
MRPRPAFSFPLLLLAALAALGETPAYATGERKPNIILIMADDLGWTDLGCYGSKFYETPNLDKLASQGMRFTSAYTSGPNCAPTRAALYSGQYGPRTGVYTVASGARGLAENRKLLPVPNVTNLPLETVTLGQAMKDAGYTTALFGKWHLGGGKYHPSQRGFDEAVVSMGKHFNFNTDPKVKVPPDAYLADFLTDRAVDFIERHRKQPFFLCVMHFGVHTPHEAKKELVEKFRTKQPVGGHHDPVYAAMIYSLDESVGRIMARLEELDLADDTIIIFTSDNGGVGGYKEAGISGGGKHTNNAPLRGGKGMLYEGGVRVVFIVRWKRRVRPGTNCDVPIASIDLYPTCLQVGGGKARGGHTLDGVSIAPLLESGGKGTLKRDLFWHFPGYLEAGKKDWRTTPAGAIRSGDWKLHEFFEDGRIELYNLKDDLGEKNNLAAKMPELAKQLHQKLKDWRATVKAPMPTPDPAYGKKAGKTEPARRERPAPGLAVLHEVPGNLLAAAATFNIRVPARVLEETACTRN